MPGAFASLDTGFPNLSGNGSTDDKLRAIQDYLYQLLEQLRYSMNNLGAENFNENSLKEITDKITEPIKAEIVDVERGLTTLIEITAEGVRLDVRRDYAAEWTSANNQKYYVGDVVKVTASDNSMKFYKCTQNHTAAAGNKPPSACWTQIAAADVAYSRFDMNADAIRTEVTRATAAEGTLSTSINQTADAITLAAYRSYAPLWAAGEYYYGNIVRKETTSGGVVTVRFYKCTAESTSLEPPNTGWTEIQSPDVLNSRFTVTADAIKSEVTRATDAEGDLSTSITETAKDITLAAQRTYAPLWAAGTYYNGNIVRKETTVGDTVTVKFYKCTVATTTQQPPNTDWTEVQAADVLNSRFTVTADAITSEVTRAQGAEGSLSARITQLPDEIMLNVRKDYADAWRGGNVVTYHTNDIVRIVSDDSITFYKCLADHQANSGNRPGTSGGASYWTEITQPNVQSMIDLNLNGVSISYDSGQSGANAPYITLNKDGTTIGGGPVYIGELNADTITTGTMSANRISGGTIDATNVTITNLNANNIKSGALDADNVELRNKFIIKAKNTNNGNYYSCGGIGGVYTRTSGQNHYSLYIGGGSGVQEGDSSIEFEEENIRIYSEKWDSANQRTDYVVVNISPSGVTLERKYNGVIKTVDLFNL